MPRVWVRGAGVAGGGPKTAGSLEGGLQEASGGDWDWGAGA